MKLNFFQNFAASACRDDEQEQAIVETNPPLGRWRRLVAQFSFSQQATDTHVLDVDLLRLLRCSSATRGRGREPERRKLALSERDQRPATHSWQTPEATVRYIRSYRSRHSRSLAAAEPQNLQAVLAASSDSGSRKAKATRRQSVLSFELLAVVVRRGGVDSARISVIK